MPYVSQVGGVLAAVGVGLVLYQMFFFDRVMTRCFTGPPSDTYYLLSLLTALGVSLTPFTAALAFVCQPSSTPSESKHNVFIYVFILSGMLVYRCANSSASTTLSIAVNASVDQSMRGTMNGLLMVAGSLGKHCFY